MERKLYLFWHGGTVPLPDDMAFHGDAHQLTVGMWLLRSELPRSRLYHKLKWQLPEGTTLLLAPLSDDPEGWPKFIGRGTRCAGLVARRGMTSPLAGGARRF